MALAAVDPPGAVRDAPGRPGGEQLGMALSLEWRAPAPRGRPEELPLFSMGNQVTRRLGIPLVSQPRGALVSEPGRHADQRSVESDGGVVAADCQD